ncbi:hypothetical protein DFH28DRAFT_979675 [Melampsora americana]|nr:hypothetical protein DFH28DRAFT_979675 [Melampsora americana]
MPSVYSTLFLASLPFTLAFSAERRQAVPADFSSLPSCGQTCLIGAATSGNTGCPLTDFKCLANSAPFKDSVTKCVLSSCSPSDQVLVAQWATKTSASLGTPLDLSSAAAGANATPEKKETPAPEKPSTDANTDVKPAPTNENATSDKPEDKQTSTSPDQKPANSGTPPANDGSSTTSEGTPSSVAAAPVGTNGQSSANATVTTSTNPIVAVNNTSTTTVGANPSKSSNQTMASSTYSETTRTGSESSGSTLSATFDVLSLTIVAIFVSSFL